MPPEPDLTRYEASSEPEDYRHRMVVNAAALLFLVALIGAGIWLVDTMARMQKDQNCALAGHHNCNQVEFGQNGR